MDIKSLREMRTTSSIAAITKEIEKTTSQGGFDKDTRFWTLEKDAAGNGSATIRFLPQVHEEDKAPWVKTFSHGFKGPTGKWYIEESLTTIGKEDPVGEYNSKLWNTGSDANKEIARKQKRRTNFISNILVINDPKHPENNGKVMLFRYGKSIFDKISDKLQPTFEDEKPVEIFNPYTGADFKIKVMEKDDWPNYDKSEFSAVSEMCDGDDDKILSVLNQAYKLYEFIDPTNKIFKSYDELKAKLESVLNNTSKSVDDFSSPKEEKAPELKESSAAKLKEVPAPEAPFSTDDSDDDMAYFKSIAEGN